MAESSSSPSAANGNGGDSASANIDAFDDIAALATVNMKTLVENQSDIEAGLSGVCAGFDDRLKALSRVENLFYSLHGEFQSLEQHDIDAVQRLADLEGSRDRLKERLEKTTGALGKEETSRWKSQVENEDLKREVARLTKEADRLGKMLEEEIVAKEQAHAQLETYSDSKETDSALVKRLRDQLKQSMPASQVQQLLQAAEARVGQICDSTKRKLNKMQVELAKKQMENKKLRDQLEKASVEKVDGRLKDEILLRKRAEARANDAVKKAKILEERCNAVENETGALRQMLKEAKEGLGVMRTIARIRDTDVRGQGTSIGFDAVAKKIDRVTSHVNARAVKAKQQKNKSTTSGRLLVPTAPKMRKKTHHRPEIYGGLQESKSAVLLKNFFETRR